MTHSAMTQIDERREPWLVETRDEQDARRDLGVRPLCESFSLELGLLCFKTEGHVDKHANVAVQGVLHELARYEWA